MCCWCEGRFRPFTLLHNDMLQGAANQFFCEPGNEIDFGTLFASAVLSCRQHYKFRLLSCLASFALHAHMHAGASADQYRHWPDRALSASLCTLFVCGTLALEQRPGRALVPLLKQAIWCVPQVSDTYDECVFRDDTLVLLEMTTRDMMEVLHPFDDF